MNPPIFLLLSILPLSLATQPFVPVHGCEWVHELTPLTNFTYTHPLSPSQSNTTTPPSYIHWAAPAISVSCSNPNPSFIGFQNASAVACVSPGDEGRFLVSADGKNATVIFRVYVQCAADIFAFHYEAGFEMECVRNEEGGEECGDGGRAVARCTSQQYLPPIRYPPPPPATWGR
ncbi:hypothetical protein HBI56_216850 [Parastagonospora nodorum]|uniref:AA1-like domain-containing protein n=1 Tax=Phaeosphaeria nodorum (strain SN15 / ATCC MYA-4574 / FGSC 10173) TaxID=321614 RepID=A0A7U2I1F3_PHANO|nr:hypothetical protein HBH56_175780 [Parastagonospora nodorum]QRC96241.1 hypothetical protein JI435_011950 [Parastagonospora nodorum SN15]KAH3926246.1 hypothetical protein HBH54_167390 [Parastagonospora nodorum]KAH3955840.1 hypothetical protein HBH53_000200 [Parastagonospora nodorum]KAH4007598.1 hypothetical protein HBI10_009800 [Parastagonospora nodorum]